ncbi:MAG: DUF4105 domain-containing protein [Bacteroidota bacterium]
MRRLLLVVLSLAFSATASPAQPSSLGALLSAPPDSLSDRAQVSLLTMLPGEQVYSLWGHSALRITDPATGLDRTYNYGTFDFQQPGFVVRFLRGRLDYILDTAPFEAELWKYEQLQRPIIEQVLDLTPETARALFVAIEENALPENRAYRYDFVWDNCSTRLLDMIDRALVETGHSAVALGDTTETRTFRDLVDPYTDGTAWLDFGTNLGLGLPTDQVATPHEVIFLPLELMRVADGATVDGRPLVARTDTVLTIPEYREADPALPWPALLGWLFLGLAVGPTLWMRRRLRSDSLQLWGARLDGVLFAFAGLAGIVLVLMWVATDHRVTAANLELLWLWPTHLLAAFGLARREASFLWRRYALATAIVTGLVVALWWLWPEPMHPAGIPLAVLLAFRAAMRAKNESGHL